MKPDQKSEGPAATGPIAERSTDAQIIATAQKLSNSPIEAALAGPMRAMAQYRQFICCKLVPSKRKAGKMDKLPVSPLTGAVVDAHDPAHWVDATTACAMAAAWGAGHGVGFVLSPEAGFFFVDIDGAYDGQQWSPLAHRIVAAFPGAAVEISQSGKGLHIFGRGEVPAHVCKNSALGIELYTEGRFAALAGTSAQGDAGTDHTAALQWLVAEYFPPGAAGDSLQDGEGFNLSDAPVPEWRGPTDDAELIRRAMASRNAANTFGNKASFADLWQRNVERLALAFPDPDRLYAESEADAALAAHLAFWSGKHGARIERLMRQSKLVRDKWERSDYLSRTICAVLAKGGDVLRDKPVTAPGVAAVDAVTLQGVDASLLQLGTQDSVAQIFARLMGGKMLYNHTRKIWLEWDGTRWQVEGTEKALNFARDLARSVNYDGSRALGSASFCAGVEQLAKADPVLSAKGGEFDRDNYLLNTPGGTFDLRTNTLRPHEPDDRITMCTAASPCPDGGAAFDKFMDEVTLGDRELAEFHQVSLGACLSGAVESHWMLFWIGAGRNGKNTLGDLVQDAMGDYARKVPTSTLMAKQHESHPTEIANLLGVRLALSSEIDEGAHWHEARINEVTGDATLSARFMRGDLFTFRRTHKHLIYGNHRPQLRSVGAAITSRIKIVPFKASFVGREDADLPWRLRENLGYVLAWLIEGHRKWLEAGKRLPRCKAVEDESADYFAAQSTVEMWLSERVQIVENDTRPASQCEKSDSLYRDYAEWKKARGENPISHTRWAETMGRKFRKEKSNGVRYRGLALIPHFAIPPPI